ncbi:hypothetical protein SOASR032_22230 [Pragia fontium]|uniref:Metallo-beta-lactamase domain-containing protein n=1 Tax=Pragia fontium TaxID=82985 RepID=A0ABQ5LJA6_9GAMM|nr:MBL fold metallo-hydrolase [Pragia fontium]AKJ40778.1 beta-lactamase [Pragia fontium]GKX63654.1 hypothetical protein SOASR032_22230 [Pragia fontium]
MPKANPYYDPSKNHHTPTGFCNPGYPESHSPEMVKRWQRERKEQHLPHPPDAGYPGFIEQWWQPADFNMPGNAVWWLGHATLLYQINGMHILTDPVFSLRVSPVSFYGPKRLTDVPAKINRLPPIDVVLISHNHYDHLDLPSLRRLIKHSPQVRFIVPLGLKKLVEKQGAVRVDELDWWDSLVIDGVTFTSVPARHWSVRTLWDQNQTLWCGWMISANARNYYFSGDTAYSPILLEIAQRFQSIEMAALPIGAYAPRWMMEAHHINPQEAVRLHRELACKQSFAIHWGVFELADESLDEPPMELHRALKQQGVSEQEFQLIKLGARLAL